MREAARREGQTEREYWTERYEEARRQMDEVTSAGAVRRWNRERQVAGMMMREAARREAGDNRSMVVSSEGFDA